jgi:2-oxoglutarate ferredoxin oxidoreductase subunit beta
VLEHGKPLLFGKGGTHGIRMGAGLTPEVVEVGEGPGKVPVSEILVHDEQASGAYAHMLALMSHPEFPVPVGVIRAEQKPAYDDMATAQLQSATEAKGKGDLKDLLYSGMTWEVGPGGIKH